MNQFKETKTMFECAIPVTFPLSYESWFAIRDDLKAAALYVNFYDQITLAWKFAKSDFTSEEDGISTVMQYLIKNVSVLKSDPKKYTPSYIYRVAYNCMGCLRRVQKEQDRYNLTTSNVATGSEDVDEFDLFSTMVGDSTDILETIYANKLESDMQRLIDSLDDAEIRVIESLLGGKKLGKRMEAKKESIICELQIKFAKYRGIYAENQDPDAVYFNHVLKIDDYVKSATVVMRDGTTAVYYGETRENKNGSVRVVFFGPTQDYIVPIALAKKLKVLEVELY